MIRPWTSEDNAVAVGYLKHAIDRLNKRAKIAKEKNDIEDPYYYVNKITEEQQIRLIGSMNYAFDTLTEEQALKCLQQ